MGLGKIAGKAMYRVANSKFGNAFMQGAKEAKLAAQIQRIAQGTQKAAKAANKPNSIMSKVETNAQGRILRMQEAKEAFTPYATKVSHDSRPTLQVIEDITGVQRGNVKDATGWFNKQSAADALAAFKYEPVKPTAQYVGKSYSTSVPTQKAIDDMLGIAADTPKARLELLKKRQEIRDLFNRNELKVDIGDFKNVKAKLLKAESSLITKKFKPVHDLYLKFNKNNIKQA